MLEFAGVPDMNGSRGARPEKRRPTGRVLLGATFLVVWCWAPGPGMSDPLGSASDRHAPARERMVREQIERRGVRDPAVLDAMARVPRHLFIPEASRESAYEDGPLPIGQGQTISQPYIVAFMTAAINPDPSDRVLEVGTGSGYQSAVLATIVKEVFSIEILADLGESARDRLRDLGYENVTVRIGDGHAGWPERAPFDAILVTAAPDEVPPRLLEQLEIGGRLVIPVGDREQHLIRITRTREGYDRETLLPVRFVPMTGGAEKIH